MRCAGTGWWSAPRSTRTQANSTPASRTRQRHEPSERDPDGELDRAGTANLVQRTEATAHHATTTEARRQRARGLTEEAADERVGRRPQADAIEQIEHLGAQLDVRAAAQPDVTTHGQVDLAHAKPSQRVPF